MANEANAFDFGNALDRSMNSIEDLPEYLMPDDGTYQVRVEIENKNLGDEKDPRPAVRFTYEIISTVEMKDGKPAPKDGSKFSETFYIKEELGYQLLKRQVANIWAANPELKLSQILLGATGQIYYVTTKQRRYKDKEGQQRVGFNSMGLVQVAG